MITQMMSQLVSQVEALEELFDLPQDYPILVDLEKAVECFQSLPSEMQGQIVVAHDGILSQYWLILGGIISKRSEGLSPEESECAGRLWLLGQRLPRLNAAVRCGIHNNPDPAAWLDGE